MDQPDTAGILWSVMTIAGPILLAAIIVFAMLRNRRSKAERDRSEEAVREQHNEQRQKDGLPPKPKPIPPRQV